MEVPGLRRSVFIAAVIGRVAYLGSAVGGNSPLLSRSDLADLEQFNIGSLSLHLGHPESSPSVREQSFSGTVGCNRLYVSRLPVFLYYSPHQARRQSNSLITGLYSLGFSWNRLGVGTAVGLYRLSDPGLCDNLDYSNRLRNSFFALRDEGRQQHNHSSPQGARRSLSRLWGWIFGNVSPRFDSHD